jgi:DNA-cytosine methyltransferase
MDSDFDEPPPAKFKINAATAMIKVKNKDRITKNAKSAKDDTKKVDSQKITRKAKKKVKNNHAKHDTKARKKTSKKTTKPDDVQNSKKESISRTSIVDKPTDGVAFANKVAKRARRAESPEAEPPRAAWKPILVGSDCSGYGSDFIALNLLRVDATLVFAAEMDAGKRELLKAAHPHVDFNETIMYQDVTKRNNEAAPYVDICCTGAPCQPWSQAGDKQGLDDAKGRGTVIFHSLEYVRCKRPRVVMVENVKGMTTGSNAKILETIVGMLQDLGYTTEWKILDTKDHGIPHSRPRLYLVGIRTRYLARAFEFPARIRTTRLEAFIDVDNKGQIQRGGKSKVFKEAMSKAEHKHGTKQLQQELVVIDIASSEKYSSSMVNCVPCITKSRGRSYCITKS